MSYPTLEQISSALDRAKSLGYSVNISFGRYGDRDFYSCNLYNTSRGGSEVRVQGSGETLEEAIRKCFENFPENPLDGTGWINNRLAAPKSEPVDAEFTEVQPKE